MKTFCTTLASLLCLSVAVANAPAPQTQAATVATPTRPEIDLMGMTQDARCKQILVTGLVNGQPVKMMLDTGATHTVLHTGSAEKLKGVKWIDTSKMQFRGNSSQRPQLLTANLQIGPGESDNHTCIVMDLSGVRSMMAEPDTLDGIVGMDILNALPFTFDFAQKEYYWGTPTRGNLVPLTGERDPNGRLMMNVRAGDKTFTLLLDSGSSVTRICKNDWAPGEGQAINAQIGDIDTASKITTMEGAPGDLTLADGIIAKNLAPILSETNALTMLGVDALANTALVHIPNPTARFGSFFLLTPTK